MAMCDICKKTLCFGIKISHSHRRSNRKWKPNVRRARIIDGGIRKRINVCTSCIRSGKIDIHA